MKQKPKTVKMATQCCWNYIHEQINRIATVTEQQGVAPLKENTIKKQKFITVFSNTVSKSINKYTETISVGGEGSI